MKQKIGEILLSEEEISQRVKELGQQISNDYRGKRLIIICVLKGAVIFAADLLRNLDISADLDFIQVSSYGDKTESTGAIEVIQDLATDIAGQNVLIIDDIIDSGLTLHHLKEKLLAKQPASLRLCVLVDKSERRKKDVEVDYVGFRIPNRFVIGYGLDYAGEYRGLPYIAILE